MAEQSLEPAPPKMGQKRVSFDARTTKAEPRAPPPQFYLPLNVAFYLCLLSHVLAAAYAPITDCDEVFNYWEPLHYLNHRYGLQTWEYSPEFAVRSWLYIVIHAIPAKLGYVLGRSKSFEFYFLRTLLAIVCAGTETRLFGVISRTLNPRIGIIYLMIVAFSPGIFYASVAYLPSTFSMYTSNLGLAAFMDWRSGPKTAQGIMWFGIGAVVAWPFSGILVAPFILEEVIICIVTGQGYETFRRFLDGVVRSLIPLALQVAIDAFFYHKFVIVPLRIVLYNVLSGSNRGPNIFGTEPWDFYSRNLLLNFNVWYLLAVAVGPLLFMQYAFRSQATTKQTLLRTVIFITPFYLWVAIFTLQPHKEERFMYPVYPFLALNAAIAFHMILAFLGSTHPKSLVGKIPTQVKLAFALLVVVLSLNIGLLRTIGTVTAYRAPLQVYQALEAPGMARPGETVCLGKEWYRFPSSFLLPNGARAKFIKSEFSGLMPGEFNEAKTGFGFFAGTWLIPAGMNDRNEEDLGKYVGDDDLAVTFTLTPSRPTFRTVPTSWTHTCQDHNQVTWNHIISRMIGSGRKYPAHRFSIRRGQAFLREQYGSRIFPSSRQGFVGNGEITVSFDDDEGVDRFIHDSGCSSIYGNEVSDISRPRSCVALDSVCERALLLEKENPSTRVLSQDWWGHPEQAFARIRQTCVSR